MKNRIYEIVAFLETHPTPRQKRSYLKQKLTTLAEEVRAEERERVESCMKSVVVHGDVILDEINFGLDDKDKAREKICFHFKKIQNYLNKFRWGDNYLSQPQTKEGNE